MLRDAATAGIMPPNSDACATMIGLLGMPCIARQWLAALEMAVNRQFPDGTRSKGVALRSDHGCQPTAMAFMKACSTLGIHQTCTSGHNPKGNADTERMMRALDVSGKDRRGRRQPRAVR
jgi:transposase InsO family protein